MAKHGTIKKREPNLIAWREKELYRYLSKHVIWFNAWELSEHPIRAGQRRKQRWELHSLGALSTVWWHQKGSFGWLPENLSRVTSCRCLCCRICILILWFPTSSLLETINPGFPQSFFPRSFASFRRSSNNWWRSIDKALVGTEMWRSIWYRACKLTLWSAIGYVRSAPIAAEIVRLSS